MLQKRLPYLGTGLIFRFAFVNRSWLVPSSITVSRLECDRSWTFWGKRGKMVRLCGTQQRRLSVSNAMSRGDLQKVTLRSFMAFYSLNPQKKELYWRRKQAALEMHVFMQKLNYFTKLLLVYIYPLHIIDTLIEHRTYRKINWTYI